MRPAGNGPRSKVPRPVCRQLPCFLPRSSVGRCALAPALNSLLGTLPGRTPRSWLQHTLISGVQAVSLANANVDCREPVPIAMPCHPNPCRAGWQTPVLALLVLASRSLPTAKHTKTENFVIRGARMAISTRQGLHARTAFLPVPRRQTPCLSLLPRRTLQQVHPPEGVMSGIMPATEPSGGRPARPQTKRGPRGKANTVTSPCLTRATRRTGHDNGERSWPRCYQGCENCTRASTARACGEPPRTAASNRTSCNTTRVWYGHDCLDAHWRGLTWNLPRSTSYAPILLITYLAKLDKPDYRYYHNKRSITATVQRRLPVLYNHSIQCAVLIYRPSSAWHLRAPLWHRSTYQPAKAARTFAALKAPYLASHTV